MIRNARELEARRQELAGLAALKRGVARMAKNFAVDATEIESLLDDRLELLSSQIKEYGTREYHLKQHNPSIEHLKFIDMLPRALIEARIAVGWTQRDLSRHAQMQHQQISRYENSMYAKISLAKAIEIASLLTKRHGELLSRGLKFDESADETQSKEFEPKPANS